MRALPRQHSSPDRAGSSIQGQGRSFIGVDVWEHDTSKVKPFVAEMGDKMDYRVALDSVPEKGKAMDGVMAKPG